MQYLTFTLNDSLYAVSVLQVREVLGYHEPQELPCPDPVIAGLIRSRGQSISVVNLRHKFGFPEAEPTKDTRIIVLEIDSISENSNTEGQLVFGAIVDSVNEVIEMDASVEEPPPEVGNSIAADFISGIGQQDDRFVIMLNIDKVLTFEQANPLLAMQLENEKQLESEDPEQTEEYEPPACPEAPQEEHTSDKDPVEPAQPDSEDSIMEEET